MTTTEPMDAPVVAVPQEAPIVAPPTPAPVYVPPVPVPPPVPDMFLPYAVPARGQHPILGAILGTFAALLWSYVIAGQLTTSWFSGAPMEESTAVWFVFLVTVTGWIRSVRRSQVVPARTTARLVGRAALAFFAALFLFFIAIFIATVVGRNVLRGHDVLTATVLVLWCFLASHFSRRFTRPETPAVRTVLQRRVGVALWIAIVLTTLVAGVQLVMVG